MLDHIMESGRAVVAKEKSGQIITFYSFKGGVGRTMALANVAFLAASNGLRVLAMDWDLEAPGLLYYFRGLRDPSAARELRQADGVLNILWDWVSRMRGAQSEAEVEQVAETFRSGAPFSKRVLEVADEGFFGETGCLDFIGAGSPRMHLEEPLDYEEALARFPWHDFFEKMAGGFVAQSLRDWAKSNYDLILVDSRTGLAEAAGLCTLYLPDTVAMCFILNRQNIDGIARISSAVRSKRKGVVNVMAAPMRVARHETSEESDARARAIFELTRVGGFSSELAQQQLKSLAIAQAENIPFYESLAPIVAEDPALDALTLNYLRFGSELSGHRLSITEYDPSLLALVRARLQPRHATAEYVGKLTGSEPVRAIEELRRLLDSAQEVAFDGNDLEKDYVQALVTAVFSVNEPQYMLQIAELQRHAIDLLRVLRAADEDWTPSLIESLELHVSSAGAVLEEEEEIAAFEELDTLLSPNQSPASRIRRVSNRRRIAWLYARERQFDATNQAVGEILAQTKDLRSHIDALTNSEIDELTAAEVDMRLLRGYLAERSEQPLNASNEYLEGLRTLGKLEISLAPPELRRQMADLHTRMALLEGADTAMALRRAHAVDAVRWGGSSPSLMSRFLELGNLLLLGPDADNRLLEFLELMLGSGEKQLRPSIASFFSRTPRQAITFLEFAERVANSLGPFYPTRSIEVLRRLALFVEAIVIQMARRRVTLGQRVGVDVLSRVEEFQRALRTADIYVPDSDEFRSAMSSLGRPARRIPDEMR